jgi:hypothetical protein
MRQAHRHVDTRFHFSREGSRAYCRDCKKWRTTFETGWQPEDGYILGPWPNPPKGSFQWQTDRLRQEIRELSWDILEAAGIPRLVRWLEIFILRCRISWAARSLRIGVKGLTASQIEKFLDEIGMTEEQFKSIRKDI